jgi:hypothetical protein
VEPPERSRSHHAHEQEAETDAGDLIRGAKIDLARTQNTKLPDLRTPTARSLSMTTRLCQAVWQT